MKKYKEISEFGIKIVPKCSICELYEVMDEELVCTLDNQSIENRVACTEFGIDVDVLSDAGVELVKEECSRCTHLVNDMGLYCSIDGNKVKSDFICGAFSPRSNK